jgi:hypothetical protein
MFALSPESVACGYGHSLGSLRNSRCSHCTIPVSRPFWSLNMATKDHRHEPNHAVQSEGYERRDANIPALLKLALGLAILIAVTLVAVNWTFKIFDQLLPLGPPAAPFEQTRQLPPSPRLQAAPHVELKDYCVAQQKNVDSYAWVDQQQGTVRIPIDRAMDLILQQGLPARPASAGSSDATPASDLPGVAIGAQNTQAASYLSGPCGYLAAPDVVAPKD